MRETLETVFGAWGAVIIQFLVTILVVAGLIALVYWLIQRFSPGGLGRIGRGRVPRLALVDAMPVDGRRRLVLVRRDHVEHLIMIGGPADVVVEAGIQRPRRSKSANGDYEGLPSEQAAELPAYNEPLPPRPLPVPPAPTPLVAETPAATPVPSPARAAAPSVPQNASPARTQPPAPRPAAPTAAPNPFQQPPRPASNGAARSARPAASAATVPQEGGFTFRRSNIAPAQQPETAPATAAPAAQPVAVPQPPETLPPLQPPAAPKTRNASQGAGAARLMDFDGPTRIEAPAIADIPELDEEALSLPELFESEGDSLLPPEDVLPAFLTQNGANDADTYRDNENDVAIHAPVAMNPFARSSDETTQSASAAQSETARKVNDLEREMARLLGEIGAKPS